MPQQYTLLTVQDIVDRAKAEAISSTTSRVTALQDAQIIEHSQWVNDTFVQAGETDDHGGAWSHMGGDMATIQNIKTLAHSSLAAAAAAGAASLNPTDSSTWPSTGRVILESAKGSVELVDYSANAANILTVDTTGEVITVARASGEHIETLYPLPDRYSKTKEFYVNRLPYDLVRNQPFFPIGRAVHTLGNYLLLPKQIGAQDITHYYTLKGKKFDSTASTSDITTDIPEEYARYPIEMMLLHIFRIRRKRKDQPTTLQLAKDELERALQNDKQYVSQPHQGRVRTSFA